MNAILYWNDVALEANRVSHTNGKAEQTGPTLSSRALAIVHLAMHDAFFGIAKKYRGANYSTYLSGLPAVATGASKGAAVAAAAHYALCWLFPSQKACFDERLFNAPIGGGDATAGRDFGLAVGQALQVLRKNDPDAGAGGYAPSVARYAHRLDPQNPMQGFHAPYYGDLSKPFAVTDLHELNEPHRPDGPAPSPAAYEQALNEVRGLGIDAELMATLPPGISGRTAEQTLIGTFWAYDGSSGLGTPPRLYNQIVRQIAGRRAESRLPPPQQQEEEDDARLFTLIHVAMADAGILAWREKYFHDLWRPVIGIREHDMSMGPTGSEGGSIDARCDPFWLPLGGPASNEIKTNFTPPFPAYPSGHATFGAAAFQIARLFFGVPYAKRREPDNLGGNIDFVSDELNGLTKDNRGVVRPRHARRYPNGGLWQMIEENARSRVYLGVHWIFDAYDRGDQNQGYAKNIGGVPLGLKIAEDIWKENPNGLKQSPAVPEPRS